MWVVYLFCMSFLFDIMLFRCSKFRYVIYTISNRYYLLCNFRNSCKSYITFMNLQKFIQFQNEWALIYVQWGVQRLCGLVYLSFLCQFTTLCIQIIFALFLWPWQLRTDSFCSFVVHSISCRRLPYFTIAVDRALWYLLCSVIKFNWK